MTLEREELTYRQILDRIGELAEELATDSDPAVAERVTELLDWVDAFHREGLGRVVEAIRAWRGDIFLDTLADDEIAGTMLAVYGLGSDRAVVADAEDAVNLALEEIRPLVESHGGAIEVVEVADGVVKVRMQGTCNGCPSSSATLTYGLEEALRRHWPNFRHLEEVDAAGEVDPDKADLECVTAPPDAGHRHAHQHAAPEPQPQLLQIRGFEGR